MSRARDQRGNALVEAVIILPILMLLTFGGIELGIGFGQKGALESATRAGARIASTLTDDVDLGPKTVVAVNAALDSTAVPQLDGLWIYKSTEDPGDTPGSCGGAGHCWAYTPSAGDPAHFDDSISFGPGWAVADRDGCGATPDRVTVKIKGTFSFLTNLIGNGTIDLHSTTTLQFEPTNCAT